MKQEMKRLEDGAKKKDEEIKYQKKENERIEKEKQDYQLSLSQ